MAEDFWIKKASLYSNEKFEINELGTHPILIEAYNRRNRNWTTVLDYGCGDGSLIQKLEDKPEVSLFDISESMLEIAGEKLASRRPRIYHDARRLPGDYFDCVFLSMVLVCVNSEKDFEFIIDRIAEVKKQDGLLFIANPHPCFRDKPFSSYYTEYTIGKPFDYFDNGGRHEIFIRDKPMSFFDYNWSISYLLNTCVRRGFALVEMTEVRDNQTNEYYNESCSPSIIYAFK